MRIAAVADTHAALWYLLDDPRLSPASRAVMRQAEIARHKIAVSSISLVEVAYLVEKGRIPPSAYEVLAQALADPEHVFMEAPLNAAIATSLRQVPRDQVPDMPDRIIAATALHFRVPLLIRDRLIRATNLQTIW